ncbi:MAG: hypothetical protein QW606_05435 [Conexivisphaerales archaeon]
MKQELLIACDGEDDSISSKGTWGTTSPTACMAERRGRRVINPATVKCSEWFRRNLRTNLFMPVAHP